MNEHLIILLAIVGFFVAKYFLREEQDDISGDTRNIKIVSCSNPFSWYVTILKSKDEESKIFEVESELTEDGFYRTVEDVAGPDVKGLINPKDTKIV